MHPPVHLLLLAIAFVGERIEWKPFTESPLTWEYERELALACAELESEFRPPIGEPGRLPDSRPSTELRESLRGSMIDVHRDEEGERWTRRFGAWKLERTLEGGPDIRGLQPDTWEAQSELEDVAVEFRWNASSRRYVAQALDPSFLEHDVLAGLRADAELRGLAPERNVEIGDEWVAEPATMAALLALGGDLQLLDSRRRTIPDSPFDWLVERFEDGPRVRFARVESLGDERVAVLELSGRLRARSEPRRSDAEANYGWFGPHEAIIDSEDLTLEVRGEVAWDLARGYLRTVEMKADVDLVQERVWTSAKGGWEIALRMHWSGELSVRLRSDPSR